MCAADLISQVLRGTLGLRGDTMHLRAPYLALLGLTACLAADPTLDPQEGGLLDPSQGAEEGIQIGEEDCGQDLVWVWLEDAEGEPLVGSLTWTGGDLTKTIDICDAVCTAKPLQLGVVYLRAVVEGVEQTAEVLLDEDDAIDPGSACNWHEDTITFVF
jgi:hypothetical protein